MGILPSKPAADASSALWIAEGVSLVLKTPQESLLIVTETSNGFGGDSQRHLAPSQLLWDLGTCCCRLWQNSRYTPELGLGCRGEQMLQMSTQGASVS